MSEEVAEVTGVRAVDVDVTAGRVTVRGDGFTDEAIRAAVDEAGYEVVSASSRVDALAVVAEDR